MSVVSGVMQANAMSDASDSAAESSEAMLGQAYTNAANLVQRQKEARDLTAPYLSLGTTSSKQLYNDLLTPGGRLYDTNFTKEDLYADPSYGFRKQEGIDAVNAGNAASGLFGSGRGYNALMARGQDMASQEYDKAYTRHFNDQAALYNRLLGTTNLGQNTALNLSNIVNGLQGSIGNMTMQGQMLNYTAGQNAQNTNAMQMQGLNNTLQSGLGTYMRYRDSQNALNNGMTGPYYSGAGQTGVGYATGTDWTQGLGF